jgi:hypothetical protein
VNVFLTLDYELFFGDNPGTVEKCMIEPTNMLLEICQKHQIGMTFFVDAGHLSRIHELKNTFPHLQEEESKISQQLRQLLDSGCDIQLHVHPHWEFTTIQNGIWNMSVSNHYKLSDFTKEEAATILRKYKSVLEKTIGRKVHSFRAGGWCIQPFTHIASCMKELELIYDTSVFPGGKMVTGDYNFDFTKAPKNLGRWSFSTDECIPDETGYFTEIPISTHRYSPFFYWELFAWGRIAPKKHKFIGDGNYIPQPGRRKELLTRYSWNHASFDGYYAKKMSEICINGLKNKHSDIVFIGHPKGMTHYSIKQINDFIKKMKHKVQFTTFNDLK